MSAARPAVFFDRDGVLNEDLGYVSSPARFHWIESAQAAVARLNRLGYVIVVVTNQSGIARGYYDEKDFHSLHSWIDAELAAVGARIDAVYFCPHHPEAALAQYRQHCACRKPRPGMLIRAMQELGLDRKRSLMIGDKESDQLAAAAAGMRSYTFRGGNLLEFVSALLPSESTSL